MTKRLDSMKPDRCPACNGTRVADILYGFPTSEAMDAAARDELVLGGCEINEFDPCWQCLDCHIRIYPERLHGNDDTSPGMH